MTARGARRNRDSVWQGVDTRQRNQALREIAERDRQRPEPSVRQPQHILCSLGCRGINHVESCPNIVRCAKCGCTEFNRYEGQCLFCGSQEKLATQ